MDPSYSITVQQRDIDKSQRWPVSFLKQVVRTTLHLAPCREDAEVSLTLTTDRRIRQLNARYRGIDQATDVLAFALEEGDGFHLPEGIPRQLGDIVVSLETTGVHSQQSQNNLKSELAWVICHGTLHLLGFDHQTEDQLKAMRERERAILETLQIPRDWPELWPSQERSSPN